jgi:prepilin peptidase CpaA
MEIKTMSDVIATMAENWVYWAVSIFAIVAAYIDGKELRVPNKLTFPMIIAGWIWSSIYYGMEGDGWYLGLAWSLAGTAVGIATLLPAYSVGGMGAGDVKMMAAIGAWVHCTITFYAFCVSAIVGAILAVAMVLMAGEGRKHFNQFFFIINEITTIKNPETLSEIAAERKQSMRLLPYGIPLAIGTVLYFAWNGLLI